MSVAESETLSVSVIRQDGGTQARAEIDAATVHSYASSMDDGVAFPAIVVFYDGTDYWLADGFHRLAAIVSRGVKYTASQVKPGTRDDAILYAACANKMHGLRRTNEDKRRAVEMLLACEKWAGKSDRWIAEQTGVAHPFVGKVRSTGNGFQFAERTGQDGKTRKVPDQQKRTAARECAHGSTATERDDKKLDDFDKPEECVSEQISDVEKAWLLVSRLNESGLEIIINRIFELKGMHPE